MNTWNTLLLLLVLAVVTGWFLQNPETDSQTAALQKSGPDMFADQVEVSVMDESGQVAYHISALQLHHFPDTERFALLRPFIEIRRRGGDNWSINSERGQMTDNGEELLFLGEVNIRRTGARPMHIKTSDLRVKPDDELAETENAVAITSPGYRVNAIGFKADFGNNLLEFNARVRGSIDVAG